MTKVKISHDTSKIMTLKHLNTVQYLSGNFLAMRTISSSLFRV